ncbi:hypothetical protein E2C01_014289 [Portunus trituberculatus]|uniref:Uncharacterized protein n=1 Tax=Portunus trituberculatus TaxID=210409 RepID=A0A5B7DJE5_PORTR|nr:hypothetical protein [Portunus trituberculatus]
MEKDDEVECPRRRDVEEEEEEEEEEPLFTPESYRRRGVYESKEEEEERFLFELLKLGLYRRWDVDSKEEIEDEEEEEREEWFLSKSVLYLSKTGSYRRRDVEEEDVDEEESSFLSGSFSRRSMEESKSGSYRRRDLEEEVEEPLSKSESYGSRGPSEDALRVLAETSSSRASCLVLSRCVSSTVSFEVGEESAGIEVRETAAGGGKVVEEEEVPNDPPPLPRLTVFLPEARAGMESSLVPWATPDRS